MSPQMPSCAISLLARALSDTNTIGCHVDNVGAGRDERRELERTDRREKKKINIYCSTSTAVSW